MQFEVDFATLTLEQIESRGLASFIEQTLLKPDATPKMIESLCAEALEFKFRGVCVHSSYVPLARKILGNSEGSPLLVTVVGFPNGANCIPAVRTETQWSIEHGADEIDMVLPVGRLKGKDHSFVSDAISAVVDASANKLVKVILETCLLTQEEKIDACKLALAAQAHFVKTSTGFSSGGATRDDVQLMKSVVGNRMGVKASGGVRSRETAIQMLLAGAHRLGTSSGAIIVGSDLNTNSTQSGY